jgi:hypothetical protein
MRNPEKMDVQDEMSGESKRQNWHKEPGREPAVMSEKQEGI